MINTQLPQMTRVFPLHFLHLKLIRVWSSRLDRNARKVLRRDGSRGVLVGEGSEGKCTWDVLLTADCSHASSSSSWQSSTCKHRDGVTQDTHTSQCDPPLWQPPPPALPASGGVSGGRDHPCWGVALAPPTRTGHCSSAAMTQGLPTQCHMMTQVTLEGQRVTLYEYCAFRKSDAPQSDNTGDNSVTHESTALV